MKIYLIGMPGCGKTTLGRELAAKLNLVFVDLDEKIEKETNKSIKQIFEDDGEMAFREMEAHLLRSLTDSYGSFVMSTGGGAPCYYDNMDFMNASGSTVYLNVSSKELYRRLDKDSDSRPLLTGSESLERSIENLLVSRQVFYARASVALESDSLSIKELEELFPKN